MDPRFQRLLSDDNKDKAKTYLLAVHDNIILLENDGNGIEIANHFPEENSENIDEPDEFENFINNSIKGLSNVRNNHPTTMCNDTNVRVTIDSFDNIPYVSYKTNIREYWEKKNTSDPILFNLSQVILAVPATQVSIYKLITFKLNI